MCPLIEESKKIDHTNVDLGFEKDNNAFCLSMGNPHAVFFVDSVESVNVSLVGPKLENHPIFPEKANISFAEVKSKSKIRMKVWERGAGPTLACGTGACAIHVAAYKLGLCNSQTIVTLPGGNLKIDWSKDDCEVMMTGNAKKVFSGSMLVN